MSFHPSVLATKDLGYLRDSLHAVGYRTDALAANLGLSNAEALLADVARNSFIYSDSLQHSPVDILFNLFLFCAPVSMDAFFALPKRLTRELLEHNLVRVESEGGLVIGNVTISEINGCLYLADRLFENRLGTIKLTFSSDSCMPPHVSSFELMQAISSGCSSPAVLDVGCGSGCLTLPLARSAGVAVGIDINDRAVEFARINAALNGMQVGFEHVEWENFLPDRRYDHIVFNAPNANSAFAFLAGGIPRLLATGGRAHIWLWCEVLASDGGVQGTVSRLANIDPAISLRIVANDDSPFSLSRHAITAGERPWRTLLVERTSDWPSYIDSLRRRGVIEVVSLVLEISNSEHSPH